LQSKGIEIDSYTTCGSESESEFESSIYYNACGGIVFARVGDNGSLAIVSIKTYRA
jgi:hypothetical protein